MKKEKLKLRIYYDIESKSGMGGNWEMERILDSVLNPFGWESVGRGSGFGGRDIEYEFNPTLKRIPFEYLETKEKNG